MHYENSRIHNVNGGFDKQMMSCSVCRMIKTVADNGGCTVYNFFAKKILLPCRRINEVPNKSSAFQDQILGRTAREIGNIVVLYGKRCVTLLKTLAGDFYSLCRSGRCVCMQSTFHESCVTPVVVLTWFVDECRKTDQGFLDLAAHECKLNRS